MCDPVAARESVFHLLAKQTLCDRRCLSLPPIKLVLDNHLYHLILKPPATVDGLEVNSEQTLADSDFRADSLVSLQAGSAKRSLVVEWVVTHKCEAAKLAFLRSRKIPSLEIEIGDKPDSLSPEEAEKWILHDAPRQWIWHPFFEWDELKRHGLVLTRRLTHRAVRFYRTKKGVKAVEANWVKNCPLDTKIVSVRRCKFCPYAYSVEPWQSAYVECLGQSADKLLKCIEPSCSPDELADLINACTGGSDWCERATQNLGDGFRAGWDKPRSDLHPGVQAELLKGPFFDPLTSSLASSRIPLTLGKLFWLPLLVHSAQAITMQSEHGLPVRPGRSYDEMIGLA